MKEFVLLIFLAGGDYFEVADFETMESCKTGGRVAIVEMAKRTPDMRVKKAICQQRRAPFTA